MSHEEIVKELFNIVAYTFDIPFENVNEAMEKDNTEKWDSLNHLNLFLEIEEKMGIKLSAREINEATNIRVIIDNLKERG